MAKAFFIKHLIGVMLIEVRIYDGEANTWRQKQLTPPISNSKQDAESKYTENGFL